MGEKIKEAIKIAMEIKPGWITEADFKAIGKRLPKGKATALETGTAFGRSSVFMANMNPEMLIYTIDNLTAPSLGCGKEKEQCRTIIRKHTLDYPNIHFLEADSRKLEWKKPLDFMFIDGNHTYEFVKSDFERFSPFIKKGGIVAFHDVSVTGRDDVCVKKYIDETGLPVEIEANVAFWKNQSEEIIEIINKTKAL